MELRFGPDRVAAVDLGLEPFDPLELQAPRFDALPLAGFDRRGLEGRQCGAQSFDLALDLKVESCRLRIRCSR